jgi:hypothetical protein
MGFRLVSRTYETKEFFFGEHRGTQIPKILKSKIILSVYSCPLVLRMAGGSVKICLLEQSVNPVIGAP